MALETGIVVRVMESVEFVREMLQEHPSLSPLVIELLNGSIKRPIDSTPMRSAGTASASATKPKRKMTAAQLEANSKRMKARWKKARKMGKSSLAG